MYVNNPQRTFRRRRGRFIVPVHTELYKCNHASQWTYEDKHWLYTVIRTELYKCNHASQWVHVGKCWCTWTIRSVHSVGVGVRFIAPVHTNYVNTTTYHKGYSKIKHWLHINNRSAHSIGVRFIAPVHIELYKCNHASQWVYVGKCWCTWIIRSAHSVGVGADLSCPFTRII